MKNRDQIDLAAWEFFWKRTKKEVNDEGTRPDMIIGYREGYEEAIRDFKAGFVVPEALSKPFKDKSVWQTIKEREEEKEEKQLIKKILSDPRNADGFSDDSHRYPKYRYDGYTYILNDNLTKIMSVSLERDASRWHLEESLKERDKVTKKFKLEDSFKATLESAVKGDVPAKSWMDAHKENYDKLLASGMFWEFHPTWSGDWERDKYAFCHEQRFKKK